MNQKQPEILIVFMKLIPHTKEIGEDGLKGLEKKKFASADKTVRPVAI